MDALIQIILVNYFINFMIISADNKLEIYLFSHCFYTVHIFHCMVIIKINYMPAI